MSILLTAQKKTLSCTVLHTILLISNKPSNFLLPLLWNYPLIPWHTITQSHTLSHSRAGMLEQW